MLLLPVQHHRGPLRESEPANVAPVGLQARVDQRVDLLRRLIGKDLAAVGTRERVLPRVDVPVLDQVVLAGELHVAVVALEGPAVQLHVLVEAVLGGQLLLAQGALELVEVEVQPAMGPQQVLAPVEFAADVAHVLLVRVGHQVVDQLPLHLVALAAVLAGEAVLVGVHAVDVVAQRGLAGRAVFALFAAIQLAALLESVGQSVLAHRVLALERLVADVALEGPQVTVLAGYVREHAATIETRHEADAALVAAVVDARVDVLEVVVFVILEAIVVVRLDAGLGRFFGFLGGFLGCGGARFLGALLRYRGTL